MKTLGQVVLENRGNLGLNIIEAAERIGVSRTTFARIEGDSTKLITIDIFINLCNNLEIDFFKMLEAYKMRLYKIDIENLIQKNGRLYFKKSQLNKEKLVRLINENLKDLTE